MLKVSIVVPVYNAGPYIDRCSPSLLNQSLGRDAYEILYVDDGSTDDTPGRLDALAARHPHVRVIHQENSGWPGKPRNVGVRAARGEYVQFVDQDDELTPEALERLHRLAARNGSDIVLGKVTGTMQGPSVLFRRTVERCTAADTPLFESLTPHKMFRRRFLLDHGIEFPEGRVRLEDQLFMARAYVRAKTVSILGDYPCYVWNRREEGGNTSASATTPEIYYGHLRAVVDAIKEGTEPGPYQDQLLRRSYRVELLRPVSEPRVLQRTGKALDRYYTLVRDMALECFPPGVRDGLPAISRLRGTLLEDGNLDSLVELARRVRHIKARTTIDAMRWHDGRLHVTTTTTMLRPGGKPLTLHELDGRLLLDPDLLDGIKGAQYWEVPDPLNLARGELLVHDTARNQWWFPDTDLTPRTRSLGNSRHQVVVSGTTVIDPLTLAGGRPMPPGTHQIFAYTQLLGVGRRTRLTRPTPHPQLPPVTVGTPARLVIPTWTVREAQFRLAVGPAGNTALPHRIILRTTTFPEVRRTARTLIGRLPPSLRTQARSLARRADPWKGRP
ncbi:glycosyltransferase family 2 protein [Streptomyces sp. TRM68367]|uniref:glycosyltransferase family 2 protein n=1 Tax=Streptomyces sp. TRM68367 TaxID=2758415 RepID=UPI00165AF78D|nr:glycosyltransferase family 2 protein [Streptomyces sp. TRM68367]MBC9730949.1 glycosyltransferase family 2 protein [Streptomyces sp. TRM68367]